MRDDPAPWQRLVESIDFSRLMPAIENVAASDWQFILDPVTYYVSLIIIGNGLLQNLVNTLQLILAYLEIRRRAPKKDREATWRLLTSDVTVPISLLVPAYDEELTVVESVRSLLALHYPNFEVIVINDGSRDGTLEALVEAFQMEPVMRAHDEAVPHEPVRVLYGSSRFPNLLLADKQNGGKADALNAGINLARFPLFCAIDADSLLEADSLLRAVQPFADAPDRTVAVGGTIRIANGCRVRNGRVEEVGLPRSPLALLQTVEYLRAFLIGRMGWSSIGALLIVSGAFGIFSRDVAIEVGGYSRDTVGEDMEIIVKIHRHLREAKRDYQIQFVPDPVCWTEAPESLKVLGRQRMRWQRGTLETFFKHSRMLLNPRYGRVGLIAMGNVLITDIIGPPLEALGYLLIPLLWAFGLLSWPFFAAYLVLISLLGVFISVGSLVLEEMELRRVPNAKDLALLTLMAVAENFGYRQINSLWRALAYWQFLRKVEDWGRMTRTGFKRA